MSLLSWYVGDLNALFICNITMARGCSCGSIVVLRYCSFSSLNYNDMQQAGLVQLDALCEHQNLPLLNSLSNRSIIVNMVSIPPLLVDCIQVASRSVALPSLEG